MMDNEERMHKLRTGSDTAQWAANELTTLRAELDNIKTSWALLHTENEQLRQRIADAEHALEVSSQHLEAYRKTYPGPIPQVTDHVEHNLNMVPRITEQDAREINRGLETAAKYLEKKAQDYAHEHGHQESDTGAWVFPGNGLDYLNWCEEEAEEIRGLKVEQVPAVSVPDVNYDIKLIHDAARHLERVMNEHPYCDHVQVVKYFADIRRDERKAMLSASPAPK